NAQYWKIPACCDDDDDYDSAITPVLSAEEPHHFNAESDLVESMLNRDSSIISFSSKIDSLLDEFASELTLLKSILPGIDKTEYHPENEIRLCQRLFDSFMEEIDLLLSPDDPMPPSIEDDDNDFEGDNLFLERLLHDDPIPLPDTLDFSNVVRVFLPFFTYPSDGDVVFHLLPHGPMNSGSSRACDSVNKNKALRGRHPMLI
nr:hypothetical protein [Tanacetum cinerariifolium]